MRFTAFHGTRSRVRVIILLAIFLVVLSGGPGEGAERYEFELVNIGTGLSHDNVSCIAQDRTGYLWFGTIDGLNRYDGYGFKIYKHDPNDPNSISHNDIRALLTDRAGRLWIATARGVDRYDTERGRFIRYETLPTHIATPTGSPAGTLFEDSAGKLWIGGNGGLTRIDPATGNILKFFPSGTGGPKALTGKQISSIREDPDGTFWVGTDGGLNRLTPETGSIVVYRNAPDNPRTLAGNAVVSLCVDSEGTLWVGGIAGAGLNRFDRATGTFTRYRPDPRTPGSISGVQVWNIFEDSRKRLWISTGDAGLNLLDRATGTFTTLRNDPTDPNGLETDSFRQIFEDREGVIWIASGQGINSFGRTPRRFASFHLGKPGVGLTNERVWSFCEGPDGRLWVGTNGGIAILDRRTATFSYLTNDPDDPRSLASNLVRRVFRDRTGAIWVGTEGGGLHRHDPKTGGFTRFQHDDARPDSLASNRIRQIFEDRAGTLWVCTMGGGLERFDPNTNGFSHFRSDPDNPASLPSNDVYSVFEDRDGGFWVGTANRGMCRFDRATGRAMRYRNEPGNPKSLSNNAVHAFLEARGGTFWVCTGTGLDRMNRQDGSFQAVTTQDGLPNNYIYAALEDTAGNLWVTTNNGLCRYTPKTGACRIFTVRDGLESNEFNGGAALRLNSGEMVFGGPAGFNLFRPETIVESTTHPPVVIGEFRVFDKPVTGFNGREVAPLTFRQNFFAFEFAALSFIGTNAIEYAYRLDGFDKDWIACGSRRYASYTNLDPGDYVFHVKASNRDGVWGDRIASVQVRILPPPWRTWWAYVLYTAAFGVLTLSAFRFQANRLQSKADLREAELRAAAAEIQSQALERENRQRTEAETAIRSKNLELEDANLKLRELDQLKAGFTAMLVHDLKSPLSVVKATLDLFETDEVVLNSENGALVSVSSRGVDKILNLINEVLELYRGESQEPRLDACPINPETLLRDCAGEAAVAGRKAGIEVNSRFETPLPPISADRPQLERVLSNLLSNAVKFTPRGGTITLEARAIAGTGVEQGLTLLRISVTDTGEGIPAEAIPYLFDPYRQADSSRRRAGVGLGLAIVKRIVAAHGGNVSVRSQVGVGSTFTIILPSLQENPEK